MHELSNHGYSHPNGAGKLLQQTRGSKFVRFQEIRLQELVLGLNVAQFTARRCPVAGGSTGWSHPTVDETSCAWRADAQVRTW